MLLKKQGFPEEGELVLCTVTKIQFHSVFVNVDEYEKSGMIHISEIAPGRIRNIHDYVKEGKVVVCLVLRVNRERGHIDLSLRRVNESQKREKLDEVKQQQKCEKIIEFLAKQMKRNMAQLFDEISQKVRESKYESMLKCFEDVVREEVKLTDIGLPENIAKPLEELIKQRIKLPQAVIGGKLSMSTYEGNGVEIIQDVLKKIKTSGKDSINVIYAGGGSYIIKVTSGDFKSAEKILKSALDSGTKILAKYKAEFKFERTDKQ